ncbi:MAG: Gfo/Idh/MocA family oxidoreductase [Thermoplasmata archaeon]|nr:Gfo/Idh/MocA family oxidoreductase [Thermoplasmata archaeon]
MLRIGVIGTGVMGQNHARVAATLRKDVGLTAVSDLNEEVGKSVAKRFGCEYFRDYRGMKDMVDAVVVATPTKTHDAIAIEMLNAGKHVMVEKPLAIDVASAEKIVEAAEAQGLVLAVGHIERHNPAVKFVRTALAKGQFGRLFAMYSKRISPFPARVNDVGVVNDIGVHEVDVQRYLAESEVVSVSAYGGKVNGGPHEDHANILLDFENGVKGTIVVNWLAPIKIRKLELLCSKVFVEMDYIEQELNVSTSQIMDFEPGDSFLYPMEYNMRQIYLKKQEPLKLEHEDFVNAILEKRKPLVDGKEGVQNIRVCEAVMRAMGEKAKIEVSDSRGF